MNTATSLTSSALDWGGSSAGTCGAPSERRGALPVAEAVPQRAAHPLRPARAAWGKLVGLGR